MNICHSPGSGPGKPRSLLLVACYVDKKLRVSSVLVREAESIRSHNIIM